MYNVNVVNIVNIALWTHFDLSNVTKPEIKSLKKLAPAPSIPINQLRVQIVKFFGILTLTQTELGFTCWRRFRIWFSIADCHMLLVVLVL